MSAPHRRIGLATVALSAVLLLLTQGFTPARDAAPSPGPVRLMVLYPQPTNVDQFEADYRAHLDLLRRALDIPEGERPYTVTHFLPGPNGPAPYYQLFSLPFESAEALREARARPGMPEVAADAARISSGGPPVVLIGSDL